MNYTDEQVHQFAVFRLAKIFNIPADALRLENSFGDDLKASSVSGWLKENEHDQILADIHDVADRQTYKEIASGRLIIRTVGDYCDHMVRSYKTKPADVEHVLKMRSMTPSMVTDMAQANPVGQLTSTYLKKCGYSASEIESWTSETKLLHDLGLCGDDILDDFSILRNEFGVDLSDFDFGKYFPNELSREAYLVSMRSILRAIGLQKVANRIYKSSLARVCSKYPAVSLGMIESSLQRRKWIAEREQ